MKKMRKTKRLSGVGMVFLLLLGGAMQPAHAEIFSDIYHGIMDIVNAAVTVSEVVNTLNNQNTGLLSETKTKTNAYEETGGANTEARDKGVSISQEIEAEGKATSDPMTLSLRQAAQPEAYVENGKTYSTTSDTTVMGTDLLKGKRGEAAVDMAKNATHTGTVGPKSGWKGTPSSVIYEAQYKTSASAASVARTPTVSAVADRQATVSAGGSSKRGTDTTVTGAPNPSGQNPNESTSPIVHGVNQLMVSSKTVSVGMNNISNNTGTMNSQLGVMNSTMLRTENDTTGRQLRANAEASQPGAELDKKSAGGG